MKHYVTSFIDYFHPPFRKIFSLQTFRYAVCGGFNTVLGLLVYALSFKFLFKELNVSVGWITLKPHNAALFLSFVVSFIVGFVLNKYVVFVDSYLKGRIQLFRYFVTVFSNVCINYFLLKIFVEFLHWDEILSQLLTTCIIILTGYFGQRYFTFRTKAPSKK